MLWYNAHPPAPTLDTLSPSPMAPQALRHLLLPGVPHGRAAQRAGHHRPLHQLPHGGAPAAGGGAGGGKGGGGGGGGPLDTEGRVHAGVAARVKGAEGVRVTLLRRAEGGGVWCWGWRIESRALCTECVAAGVA